MKKLIGVAAILFTLLLSVIYRQLTGGPAKEKPAKAVVRAGLRDGMFLSCLLLQ